MIANSQDLPVDSGTDRVLVGRQPIYCPDMSVLGYELLFRDGNTDSAIISNGAHATATVITDAMMEIGLDVLVARQLAFINFERSLLMSKYCESLPQDRIVLEILETVEPDRVLMTRLKQLRRKGYRFALDDFVCSEPYLPLLEIADFVKLDVLHSDPAAIDAALSTIRKYPVKLIAEKVETREQFEHFEKLGFPYFQGYFFCRPQNVVGKRLPPNRLASIRLLTQLNNPSLNIDELEQTICQDVGLSYKLLVYINSALCNLNRHVESIRHAVLLAGLKRMRTWASLIVFSRFDDTPRDVLVTGTIRARMCELLATAANLQNPEQCFLVGLFSVLDAILNRPMEEIISMLDLTDGINQALLYQAGELGGFLSCAKAYERREWDIAQTSGKLPCEVIERAYQEALVWSFGVFGMTT